MTEKREQIERALGKFLERAMDAGDDTHGQQHKFLNRDYHMGQIINALAEQAIVIECEVEHQRLEHQYKPTYDKDATYIRGGENGLWHLVYDATLGTPGKYLFIGVPLEKAG